MLGNCDSMFRCRRHPAQPTEGICALCLKERLTRLACPCCGGLGSSRVAGISCKCSPSESASKLPANQDPVQTGSIRTIASLVQSDIEASERLNHHKLNDSDDLGSRSALLLRRAKSISLGKSSTKLSHDWESRSSRGSRRKTELSDAFDQGKVEAEPNGDATGHEESEKVKVSGAATEVIVPDFIPEAQKHPSANGFEDAKSSNCNKGVNLVEDAPAIPQQCGDASIQIHDAEIHNRVAIRSSPQARLSKSKSTGWVLNDAGGWKGSPFWGRLIHSETKKGKVKGFGIFTRSRSTKLCSSIAFQREDNKPKDFNLGASSVDHPQDSPRISSRLRIPGAIQSRWAMLIRGRNNSNAKEVEEASKASTGCRAVEVVGEHFRYSLEESSAEVRSISSLIFMDAQERLQSRKHFKVNYLGFNQLLKIK